MSKFDPARIAFPSSGDPEQDEKTAASIRKTLANQSEGLCPNGCAPLEWPDNQYECRCPVCGFHGSGYDIKNYPQGQT